MRQDSIEIKRGEAVLGRTSGVWQLSRGSHTEEGVEERDGYALFAALRIRLSKKTTEELVAGRSIQLVFEGATVFDKPIVVIHYGFPFYATGEPELVDFGCICFDDTIYIKEMVKAIKDCAELLKRMKVSSL